MPGSAVSIPAHPDAGARRTERRLAAARWAIFALALFALAAFLPGVASVPPIDRDEPRYTQATKQMLERGDYVDIRFQDAPRYKKPIGIYWLQAAAATLSGEGAGAPLWVYRIPSLLGGLAAVLLTVFVARAFLPPGPALAAGLLLSATVILGFEARVAKTDAVLLASVVAAQGALARIWLARDDRLAFLGWPALFWIAIAAGTLIKGPIIWMVSGLTVAALCAFDWSGRGWTRRLRPLPGFALALVLAAPWFVAITIATKGAFFGEAVGHDLLGKAAGGQEGHWAPPLTHLAAFFGTSWPLSAFALLAVPLVWRLRREPVMRFGLAWAVPTWLVFELVPTKLPHYTLPLVPAIAMMTAAALFHPAFAPGRALRWLAAALLFLAPLAVAAGFVLLPLFLNDAFAPAGIGLGIGAVLLAFAAARPFLAGRVPVWRSLAFALSASLLLGVGAWGFVIPNLGTLWLSPRLARAADSVAHCPDPVLVSVGFNEPSLVFLAGTDTRLTGPEEAAEALARLPCAVAAVDARFETRFREAAAAHGIALAAAGREGGVDISNGRRLGMILYRPAPADETGDESR